MHCELSNCEPEETLPPFTGFYQKFYLNDKKGSDMAASTLLSAYVLFFVPVPSFTFPLSLGIPLALSKSFLHKSLDIWLPETKESFPSWF